MARAPIRPLQAKRLALDLSQEDLAKLMGVKVQTISKWETGRGIPEAGSYKKLAEALGVTPEEVVELVRLSVSTSTAAVAAD